MSNDRSKLHHLVPAPWGTNPDGERSQSGIPRRVRPKNASRACNECQKRKIKCIGSNPCKNCHENSLYCEINDETDGRRRFALKRKVEDLEQDRHFLLGLVEALRDDEYHAMQLFNLIRSNSSLDDIRAAVHDRMERVPNAGSMPTTSTSAPESSSWGLSSSAASSVSPMPSNSSQMDIQLYSSTSDTNSTTRKIMNIDRLTDIPLFELTAKPWTEVTTDDGFVSHLVSLWLTWDHVLRDWIDKDLFIAAMKAGDVNSPFCSPFLVNIILAEACCYSSYPEAFINPANLSSRGQHFYNEAKRHLDAMEGRIDLTTVQGLGILFLSTCLMGKDRVGQNYLSQTINSVRRLVGRADEFIAQAGSQANEMERSIGLCARGIFSFLTLAGLALHTPISMRPPKQAYLPIVHHSTDIWMTYPYRTQPVPAHRNCVHNQSFDLHLIMYDVRRFVDAGEQDEQVRNACSYSEVNRATSSFYERLVQWHHNLPECIKEGQTWTPAVIGLHMYYHVYIITIFSYLKAHPSTPANVASTAQQQCIASALAVRDLMNIYRSRWRRIEYQPVDYMQLTTVCLFTLLEDLTSPGSSQAFVDLSVIARSAARRFQLARGMFRLVQLTARQQNITLPEEAQPLYQEFEIEWIRAGGVEQFSSSYPNFSLSMRSLAARNSPPQDTGDDNDSTKRGMDKRSDLSLSNAELDSFLRKWDDALKIDNEI
ncbi:nitrogen assimilation transcription factor nirA, putative [Talaromyces stipitatus ATCC 10500]|uniref:Nitrogen assimilation transcription factor nirA, putative n=1 Tax=Talaromyces stipitatus (strain ATCC 10500 / CBS 375.48 / QM 6759 / NRRL 1006) TaxID=441959 RepID=B8M434_TALSN|nr:nitrogen assimilation transcription factor nirA, putative [Talaromyces stipitatus ATCC 10500]EED20777.1 nitrogen assimilation transcription factor nirA, putative [Talaromyces stipitatus ATCC 10500]